MNDWGMVERATSEELTNLLDGLGLSILESDSRPWGQWHLIECGTNLPAPGLSFDRKILVVEGQSLLSLQFHGSSSRPGHDEIWQPLTEARVLLGRRSMIGAGQVELAQAAKELRLISIRAGAALLIPAGFLHCLINPFPRPLLVLATRISAKMETSAEREKNITRVYDLTLRSGAAQFPMDLLHRALNHHGQIEEIVETSAPGTEFGDFRLSAARHALFPLAQQVHQVLPPLAGPPDRP